MKLQTTIHLASEHHQVPIDYTSKVLFLGSCFAENIGAKLAYFKFQNLVNPFGILFHPVAIEKLITRAINETYFREADVFFEQEQWHCFEVHSIFSNVSQDTLIADLNTQLIVFKKWLTEATHLVFTFGTGYVYRHIATDTVVANCHKVPQKQFIKQLLSPDDVSDVLLGIEALVRAVNPQCVIINTVSPVRHIKDGILENSRSKAHLIAGVQEVVAPSKNNHYFPAYEIMIDELRDYRFYAEDLIHPSSTAIAILWEKFKAVWIASKTEPLQKKIDAIQRGLQHRPFTVESDAHIQFLAKLDTLIIEIKVTLPFVKFNSKT